MKKIDDMRYEAAEGCFIVRKSDGFIMGESICLGSSDKVRNYKDEAYTDESYEAFYASIGMESPKKKEAEMANKRHKK